MAKGCGVQLVTEKQVWLITVSVTVMACAIVAVAIMTFYPKNAWVWELPFGLSLTVMISAPVTYFMALKMRENALLSKELRHLLDHDRLTNTASRDYFFAQMRQSPSVQGVALMADIDHFKKVNDTFGHFAGDAVIKAVATVMIDNLRPDDVVCRFGGEEFIIFLPGRGTEDGLKSAETLRALVSEVAVMFGKQRISVTMSVGGAIKQADKSIDVAIREADAALYRAKNAGRDQTVFVTPRPDALV